MELRTGCYQCLTRLVHRTAGLASDDASLIQRAIEEGMQTLDDESSYSRLSIAVATSIHEVIRKVTNNPDPYRAMKEEETALARDLYAELRSRSRDSF